MAVHRSHKKSARSHKKHSGSKKAHHKSKRSASHRAHRTRRAQRGGNPSAMNGPKPAKH